MEKELQQICSVCRQNQNIIYVVSPSMVSEVNGQLLLIKNLDNIKLPCDSVMDKCIMIHRFIDVS